MDLYQIRYFLAVAETRNFTRAAERVHVTQPTLSAGIRKLEQDLGARLFERGRRASLTAAGSRFLDHARVIMAECNLARTELGHNVTERHLRLGTLRALPVARLAALLADFRKSHADVTVELSDAAPEKLLAWLEQGRIDLALTTLEDGAKGGAAKEGLENLALYREKLVLMAATDHTLARKPALALNDLHRQPFLLRRHCPYLADLIRLFDAHGVRTRVIQRCDQDDWVLSLVAAGIGVALMPDSFPAPGVVALPVGGIAMGRTLGLRWRDGPDDSPAGLFRSFAASHDWRPRTSESQVSQRLAWAR